MKRILSLFFIPMFFSLFLIGGSFEAESAVREEVRALADDDKPIYERIEILLLVLNKSFESMFPVFHNLRLPALLNAFNHQSSGIKKLESEEI